MESLNFDPMYFIFVIPAFLLAIYAQNRVRSAYSHWAAISNDRRVSGIDVARTLLPHENMGDVQVDITPGELSDHYDPNNNILRLSPDVANQTSIAAMSIAAHEIGHAAQDRDGYIWMKVRGVIAPLVSIGATLGYLVFIAGLLAEIPVIAWIGVLLISGGAIFSLVTLPVELDASNRAMQMLYSNGFFTSTEEQQAARDMLNAAALTYVAGAAQMISNVLYYVFRARSSTTSRSR